MLNYAKTKNKKTIMVMIMIKFLKDTDIYKSRTLFYLKLLKSQNVFPPFSGNNNELNDLFFCLSLLDYAFGLRSLDSKCIMY